MTRGDVTERMARGLRSLPSALREDLWTTARRPLPGTGRPGGDWWPVFVVPLVLTVVAMFIGTVDRYSFAFQLGVPVALLLAGLQWSAVLVALFRPVLAWWATTAGVVLVEVTDGWRFDWLGIIAQATVLFLLALLRRPRVAVEALAIALLTDLVCGLFLVHQPSNDSSVAMVLVVAVVVGAALHGRREARTRLVVQEELTAEERARRTLLEERSRIARELHDVVAHHMSVISIQAQVAPHLVENPPEELRENLAGIRGNAVEALTELRRVLGVLRAEDGLADTARYAPQPTLDRLDELVGNVRGAGLTVTTEITGAPRPLSPGVDLSAFRIVQEALSNAIRHAPGARVRVEIAYRPDGLTVRVANTAPDRPAPPSPGTGHGMLGMRERAAMLGGELAAGPTPDGGYEVTAILPADTPNPPDTPKPPDTPVEDTL